MSRRDLTPPYHLNTPADKPDLPALFPARISSFQVDGAMRTHELTTYDETDMQTYGRMCADERETWARADERRKARAELIADIQSAVNHMGCPPGLPPRGAEYFKAGARRAIDAMNSAIDKE